MIAPDDVRKKATPWWPDLLLATLDGKAETFFPRYIKQIGLDRAANELERYPDIGREQDALEAQSKDVLGYGYTLEWKTKYSRKVKAQMKYIRAIRVETLADFLTLTGKTNDYTRFVTLADQTRRHVPELLPWVRTRPQRLLDNATDWPNWLDICRFFLDTYIPDRYYVRQLPLPVHTKFLEEHNSLLMSLLLAIKPDLFRKNHRDWRQQIGLLVTDPLIRIRVEPSSYSAHRWRLAGLTPDIGLPLSVFDTYLQTAQTEGLQRVFICENHLNFLTLALQPNALAIWSGGGFNIEILANVPTLQSLPISYWGDLDAHGFQILNQCRGYFAKTQSVLMDQLTFEKHEHLKTSGETITVALPHLTNEERPLFTLLNTNNWRIEQERLDEAWVASYLSVSTQLC